MNKDVKVMIDLQRFWDNVLRGREDIEKSKKSISFWDKNIKEKSEKVSSISSDIKDKKNKIKQKEIELAEKDEHSRKLDDRKLLVKTEKEIQALEHELQKINSERGSLDEELLMMFDELEKSEELYKSSVSEMEVSTEKGESDINMLNERIQRIEEIISENKKKFDELLPELSLNVKTRFNKLIASENGKAIAFIEDDICGVCRFEIPGFLILDAEKDDKIINCTNCGKFLYKIKS